MKVISQRNSRRDPGKIPRNARKNLQKEPAEGIFRKFLKVFKVSWISPSDILWKITNALEEFPLRNYLEEFSESFSTPYCLQLTRKLVVFFWSECFSEMN